MARPKSEDKKQALLEAATQAIAQSGIAASTAVIARNAGVAEGTLFRYFATKDELINTLYLHLKQDLCQSMIMELDRSITDAKMMTRFIWNSYISWGLNHPARHRAIRQLAVSEKLTKETEQRADDMFPELRDLCHRSVLMVFMSDEYRAFGDGLFLALAETTMDDAWLERVVDQEDADGRFATPEAKAANDKGRRFFADMHRVSLKDDHQWMAKQVYLNVGNFLLGVAAMGLDAVPIEGFDAEVLDAEFGLKEKGYTSLVVVPVGHHSVEDFNAGLPKSRLPLETTLTEV